MKTALGALAFCVVLSGCEHSSPPPAPAPTLTAVLLSYTGPYLTNENDEVLVGNAIQFMALARFSDRTGQNITNLATWQTADASIATVSAIGLVQTVAPGTTSITAAYQGLTGSLGIRVGTL